MTDAMRLGQEKEKKKKRKQKAVEPRGRKVVWWLFTCAE